jgi:hypothetical protein
MFRSLMSNYQEDTSNFKEKCITYRFCQQALSVVFIIISNQSNHSTVQLLIKNYIEFNCGSIDLVILHKYWLL